MGGLLATGLISITNMFAGTTKKDCESMKNNIGYVQSAVGLRVKCGVYSPKDDVVNIRKTCESFMRMDPNCKAKPVDMGGGFKAMSWEHCPEVRAEHCTEEPYL